MSIPSLTEWLFASDTGSDDSPSPGNTARSWRDRSRVHDGGSEKRSNDEDRALVNRISQGDVSAFETLFHDYQPRLVTFAYMYTRDAEAARDIVSDVMLSLWRGRADWRPEHSIAQYLYAAVRNRTRSHRRSHIRADHGHATAARELAIDDRVPAMAVPQADPDDSLDLQRRVTAVWETIGTLPEKPREILLLRWRAQLDFDSIAAILGITKAAAHMQLSRALALLRAALPEWVE